MVLVYNNGVLTTRTALLLVLRDGPGYGRELVRRIASATGGREYAEGSVYPALRRLEADRLVRSWGVVPGRRRGGRARTYYELTERGVRVSESQRVNLLRVVTGDTPRVPGPEAWEPMGRRIELGAELSEAAFDLAIRPTPRRGGRAG
jgi:DNA-binding PadR family transcriptional regulator